MGSEDAKPVIVTVNMQSPSLIFIPLISSKDMFY